jgi:hypothetical protein
MVRRRTLILSLGLAALVTVLGAALTLRVAVSGLSRNLTLTTLYTARTRWRQGRTADAVRSLFKVGWLMLDGGARWEVAQYYLERSADLKRRHHLTEAAQACLRAADILGAYDNSPQQDRRCDLMSWEYEQSP